MQLQIPVLAGPSPDERELLEQRLIDGMIKVVEVVLTLLLRSRYQVVYIGIVCTMSQMPTVQLYQVL
jgi:hypothetical protein